MEPITLVHFHLNPPWPKQWSHSSLPVLLLVPSRQGAGWAPWCWVNPAEGVLGPAEPGPCLSSVTPSAPWGHFPNCVCSLEASPGHHFLSLGEDRTLTAENNSLVILHLFYRLFSSLRIYCKIREAEMLPQGRGMSREAAAWAARAAMPSLEQPQSTDCRGANNPSVPRAWLNTALWFIGLQIKVRPAHFFLLSMNF